MSAKIAKRSRAKRHERDERNGAVGRFHVDLELANNEDMILSKSGHLDPSKVRRAHIPAVVDTGAVSLVLPKAVVEQLGLPQAGTVKVRYADQRRAKRDKVKNVWVKLLGREEIFSAVVEPKRPDALLGAVVLEQLDLIVDPVSQKLLPRDPSGIIAEIE
jgi:clan AA aspartic protease